MVAVSICHALSIVCVLRPHARHEVNCAEVHLSSVLNLGSRARLKHGLLAVTLAKQDRL